MALTLTIENQTSLPDGGPLSVTVSGGRGLDFGRDQHLDWTLPDPSRFISGKHCEVRWRDGGYWLHDVSTNGTFLNGATHRMQEPHRLQHGDRLTIGDYIIAVALAGEDAGAPAAGQPPGAGAAPSDLWGPTGDAAPPLPRQDFQGREQRPVKPDFLDWAVETPPPPTDDSVWAGTPAPAPPVPVPPPVPAPRRPAVAPDVWGAPPAAVPAHEPPQATPVMPARPPAAAPAPVAAPTGVDADLFVRRLAAGAGVAPELFAGREPGALAEELGALLRIVATELKQLLAARAEAKRAARSSNQTMVQALDNNPLKFSPTLEDALRVMFGQPSPGYLDARRTVEQSFRDVRLHEVKTYAAMQHALRMLVEDLDPAAIAKAEAGGGGIGGLVGSKKARMWEVYRARWEALTAPHEDGILGAFMLFFAECYDKGRGR